MCPFNGHVCLPFHRILSTCYTFVLGDCLASPSAHATEIPRICVCSCNLQKLSACRRSSEMGELEATFLLGWAHAHGIGVQRNFSAAAEFYQMAVDNAPHHDPALAPMLALLFLRCGQLLEVGRFPSYARLRKGVEGRCRMQLLCRGC